VQHRIGWLGLGVVAAVLAPATAWAGTVTYTQLVALGVNEKQIAALKQLMGSELEFQPELEGVKEGTTTPTQACLANPSCVAGLAQGTTQVLTGSAQAMAGTLNLDLQVVDVATKKLVRRKTFSVPGDASVLPNLMTGIIREILIGAPTKAAQEAAGPAADDFAADPGDLEDEEDMPSAAAQAAAAQAAAAQAAAAQAAAAKAAAAEAAAAKAAAAEAARQEAARQEAARQEAARQEAARQEAARQAAAAAAAAAAKAAAAAPPAEDFDASAINFGSAVDQMSTEQIEDMIRFGPAPASAPAPAPSYAYTPPPTPAYGAAGGMGSSEEEDLEADLAARSGDLDDLDAPAKAPKPAPRPAPKAVAEDLDGPTRSTATVDRGVAENAQITLRGGYAKYQQFGFIAAGGEVALPVYEGLHVVAGIQVWSVQRALPPELQAVLLRATEWNQIYPLNFGITYKFPLGVVQPYVGADGIFAQYYNDTIETDWSAGGRARAGADFMVAKNFGINANVALGGWQGRRWGEIELGMQNSGFLPEFSAGTVFAF
jgi:hypothetical protein